MVDSADPPLVNSISYGIPEQVSRPVKMKSCDILILITVSMQLLSSTTLSSFNIEAMKAAAIGVTIIVASGDNGVVGDYCNYCDSGDSSVTNCPCYADSGSSTLSWPTSNTWTGMGYFPSSQLPPLM